MTIFYVDPYKMLLNLLLNAQLLSRSNKFTNFIMRFYQSIIKYIGVITKKGQQMDINSIKREGHRFLVGLETGNVSAPDLFAISEELDPILVYFVIKYLRLVYTPSHPDAKGVTERIVELTSTYDSIVKAVKDGEKDSLNEWFDDDFNPRQFKENTEEFMDQLVEKIEG